MKSLVKSAHFGVPRPRPCFYLTMGIRGKVIQPTEGIKSDASGPVVRV